MNWPFRSPRIVPPAPPSFAAPPGCGLVEPLLPLYADGMASPEEMRLVEAHLPGCAGCRESLFWMQATHRALAARPVAVPPANLHSRIAEAIAASTAPSLRPARSSILRPAYAAAASLTVLGVILGHSLLHSPAPSVSTVVVKPAPPKVASVPAATLKAKNVLPRASRAKPRQEVVARNVPADTTKPVSARSAAIRHAPMPEKAGLGSTGALPDRVADNAPAPAYALVPVHVQVKPFVHSHHISPGKLTASTKLPAAEARHPLVSGPLVARLPADVPLLARSEKEPLPVQVHIDPPTVIVQPPTVRLASSKSESGSLLAEVNAHARAMPKFFYGRTSLMEHEISRGGTSAIQALDHDEHLAVVDAIHGPGSP